jgi:hypothetical protein
MSQQKPSQNSDAVELDKGLKKSLIKDCIIRNWKTTATGILLSVTGFVAFSPDTFGGDKAFIVQVSRYVHLGGLATLGITAKDFNTENQNDK